MKKIQGFLSIPVAIIIAGIIVAVAVIYSSGDKTGQLAKVDELAKEDQVSGGGALERMLPINELDHIRGSLDAPVKIVEFSDTECPFCQVFHKTLIEIIDEYDGQVAWIYRHFPLVQLHPKAFREAEATECATELGGNDAFWAYIDRIFEITPANNRLDLDELPKIAEYIGLNTEDFNECLDSGRHKKEVDKDLQDAIASGGSGTPYSVVVVDGGDRFAVSGAQPAAALRQIIDFSLKK